MAFFAQQLPCAIVMLLSAGTSDWLSKLLQLAVLDLEQQKQLYVQLQLTFNSRSDINPNQQQNYCD